MGDDDWDLYTVVRGCRLCGKAMAAAEATMRDPFSAFPPSFLKAEEPTAGVVEPGLPGFPDLFAAPTSIPELEELYRSFFSKPQHQQPLVSPHRSKPSSPSALTGAAALPLPPFEDNRLFTRCIRGKRV